MDGRFVHVLTPNIYRTLAEALQTFDYITKTGNFGFLDREVARWSGVTIMVRLCVAGSVAQPGHSCVLPAYQYTLSKTTLKKRHNIGNEREALYTEVRVRCRQPRAAVPHVSPQVGKWTAALGNRKFMGGDRPNLAGTHASMRVPGRI